MMRSSPLAGVCLALVLGACRGESQASSAAAEPAPADPVPAEPATPTLVHFPSADGGVVYADEYGSAAREHGVVLAHGARFDKQSWSTQARELARADLRVLAIDFRGYGQSTAGSSGGERYAGLHLDVLAAVRHLRGSGATRVSVVGGSLGGWAAARAAAWPERDAQETIERLVLLAASPIEHPEELGGRKLFLCAEGDAYSDGSLRLDEVRGQYERAPGPKQLMTFPGGAHAQHLFASEQGPALLAAITTFLVAD